MRARHRLHLAVLKDPGLPSRLAAALDGAVLPPEVDLERYLAVAAAGEAIARESEYGDAVTTHPVTR